MDVRIGIRYIQQILLFYFRLAFNYAKTDRPDMTPKLQIIFGNMKTRVKIMLLELVSRDPAFFVNFAMIELRASIRNYLFSLYCFQYRELLRR